MRTTLSVLLSFHMIFLFAQETNFKVLHVEHDTMFSKATVIGINGKLVEERFFKTLQSQELKSIKDDLFLKGERPFYQLDSTLIYSYATDWTLHRIDTSYISAPPYDYADNEIELYGDFQFIEDRAHTKQEIEFGIRNGTPQNYNVNFSFDSQALESSSGDQPLQNRTEMLFYAELTIERGRHEYQLVVNNSNGAERKVVVEAIGYDLINNDFTTLSKKSDYRKITLKDKKELYIEAKGNFKLLTIKNRKGDHKVPVSKLINAVKSEYFVKGKNTLELINFNTGEIKVCRIKIK